MSSPQPVEDLLAQGRRALRSGDAAGAAEHFRQAIAALSSCYEAHEGLAMAAFSQKDYATAVTHFTKMTTLKPTDGKPWINLGAVFNKMQQFQKAVDALRKGIAKEKKSAEAYYNLGLAYKGLNQPAMAVTAYRDALKINPQMPEAHTNLGNVLIDMKNFQQAIAHYRQALEIDPEFERAQRGLEKAEGAAQTAKNAISPFGRLVDEKTAGRGVQSFAMKRALSDSERQEDRFRLLALCPEIEVAAKQLEACLKTEVERHMLNMNRAMAHGADGRAELMTSADNFRQSLARFVELRRALKRKILELRAHEELICMPTGQA